MAGLAHGYDDKKYLAIQDYKKILISEKKIPVFTAIHREHMLTHLPRV
jgi:hypothetical protein